MKALLASDAPLLAFFGPSAVGKSSIIQELVAERVIELTPTWTDRPKRPGEDELEHTFVTSEEFDQLVAEEFFAHPPQTFFNLPYRYAVPKLPQPAAGLIPAIMARAMVLPLLDKLYPARIIYQIEAPYEAVAERLEKRSESGVPLGTRLDDYHREIEAGRQHAKRVFINDGTLDTVVAAVRSAAREDFGIV